MFEKTLIQVAITLLFIVPGFLLQKFKKLHEDHLSSLSTVLIYVCSPCLIITSFFSLEFSVEMLAKTGWFCLITFVLQAIFIAIVLLFVKDKSNACARVVSIGGVLGNVGFFGLPLIKAIFPENPEVACYSVVYIFSMNVLVFTVGAFCLTGEKKYVSIKSAVLNPSTLAFLVGIIIYVLRLQSYVPSGLNVSLTALGATSTALCMIILGARLATVNFKELFTNKYAYIASFLKLLVFPLFCFACVYFLPFDLPFKGSILMLSGAPCASVLVGLAEIHKSETSLSATCVLLSTVCCIVTLPLLSLLIV